MSKNKNEPHTHHEPPAHADHAAPAVKAAHKKAAPHKREPATKKAPPKEAAQATIDDLIAGARDNIKLQMKQPVFASITANTMAKHSRDAIKLQCRLTPGITTMSQDAIHAYITKELDINDARP